MKSLVIVPTYNEVENIATLIGLLAKAMRVAKGGFDLLFVDDNSPDGTAQKIREFAAKAPQMRIDLIERTEKRGLAGAYLAGFTYGKSMGYEAVVEMDADLSHDPTCLPSMLEALASHDFVVGSRYIGQGGIVGWGIIRRFVSWGGSWFSRRLLGCPIMDLTGGFNAWRMETLERIELGDIISKGYSFQIELKYRAYKSGCSFKEIPIIFADRKYGTSKMSGAIFFEAIRNVIRLKNIVG